MVERHVRTGGPLRIGCPGQRPHRQDAFYRIEGVAAHAKRHALRADLNEGVDEPQPEHGYEQVIHRIDGALGEKRGGADEHQPEHRVHRDRVVQHGTGGGVQRIHRGLPIALDVGLQSRPSLARLSRRPQNWLRAHEFQHAGGQPGVRLLLPQMPVAGRLAHLLRPRKQKREQHDERQEDAPVDVEEYQGDADGNRDGQDELAQEHAREVHDHLQVAFEQRRELASALGVEPPEGQGYHVVSQPLLQAPDHLFRSDEVPAVLGEEVHRRRDDAEGDGDERPPQSRLDIGLGQRAQEREQRDVDARLHDPADRVEGRLGLHPGLLANERIDLIDDHTRSFPSCPAKHAPACCASHSPA